MAKYRVYFRKTEGDYVDVEAEDADTAINKAEKEMGSSWDFDDLEELDAET